MLCTTSSKSQSKMRNIALISFLEKLITKNLIAIIFLKYYFRSSHYKDSYNILFYSTYKSNIIKINNNIIGRKFVLLYNIFSRN